MSDPRLGRRALLAAGAVTVGAAGVGAALYTGSGPAPGGDSGDEIEEFPTEEPPDDEGGEGGEEDEEADATDDADPFVFAIDEIEECGQTCRDVTATLFNRQTETATGVTTYIRIFAGEANTDPDDVVWEGSVDIGEMDAESSHTTTERVELSLQDARTIDQEDGWVTILTSVDTDETTVTFQDSERVA